MNAPIPEQLRSQLDVMTQPEAAEVLDRIETDFDAAVTARASLIERAALPEDINDVLGGLAKPEDVTVICAAFRSGVKGVALTIALGQVMETILRREWRETAEIECLRVAESSVRVGFSVADISQADLKRAAAIAQMGVKV
ncbi:hypothetical protein OYT13_15930 [Pandoraea sp. XJJ-1]|uniref:hypothetical protein n=1 Tax=Pandoraea sp. XJJ-1 TaxID=3002643 RepID=UPI00227ED264|nr:hypothetical protein [Pandoraea sp. XJJ-1]WAL81340.1 hypothetical protein OYT13_15930 [Pandoraea sp. XJJ-1]